MSVDLSALTSKKNANGNGKSLPVFDADDEMREQCDELARLFQQEAAAKGGKEQIQSDLKSKLRAWLFELNHGKGTIQATASIPGNQSEILVALKDAYLSLDSLDEIIPIIGEELAHKYFPQIFDLKIDSKLIPEDSQQIIVDKIAGVLAEFGCADALSAKAGYKPTKAFATDRHRILTSEQNIVLESINGERGLTIMSVAPARGRK